MSIAENPTPDEDKWRLRERLMEFARPIQDDSGLDQETRISNATPPEGFDPHFFRPRSGHQIKRTRLKRIKSWLLARIRPLPKGVNDNGQFDASSLSHWRAQFAKISSSVPLAHVKRLAPHIKRHLRPRLVDAVTIPLALMFFLIPLFTLLNINPNPSATALGIVLIGSSLLASLLIGPRFGSIATLSAYTWLGLTVFRPATELALHETIAHWLFWVIGGAALAGASVGLGFVSVTVRNLLRLALASSRREADIAEFHMRLKRARNTDAILSYIIAYCRENLNKRAIFLALDELAIRADMQEPFDIAAQLKSVGYARVIVDRIKYLPRAIQSFTSAGYKAFPIETASGTIALLGIEIADSRKLSSIDERYLKLLLVSAAYALERAFLKERVDRLEESQIETKARNAALLGIIGNLESTTTNIDDQAHALHQLLEREAHRPYDTAINFIRRNISALHNSIALLRDVTS